MSVQPPIAVPGLSVARAFLQAHLDAYEFRSSKSLAQSDFDEDAAFDFGPDADATDPSELVFTGTKAPAPDDTDRPWLTVQLLEQLTLILGMAQALEGCKLRAQDAAEIRVFDRDLVQHLTELTTHQHVLSMLFDTDLRPRDVDCFDFTSLSDNTSALKSRGRDVQTCLRKGKTAVLFTSAADQLPARVRARSDRTVHLQSLTRETLFAILFLIFPDRPSADPDSLPSDAELQRLDLFDVLRAVTRSHLTTLGTALQHLVRTTSPGASLTLAAVKGHATIKAELEALIADLERWKSGSLDWTDIPNGYLFCGAPGTGKTFLARACAGSAGVPIVVTSYGEAAATDRGGLGSTLAKLLEARDEAWRKRPAILFIDEIDGLGSRFGKQDHNSSYYRSLITGVLRITDSIRDMPGIILMAATNDIHALDPALRRAGRFDRLIECRLPSKSDIVALLQSHLPDCDTVELAAEADALIGMTPAQICNLVRQAASRARADGRTTHASIADLQAARQAEFPDYELVDFERVAIHEAGHLVAGHVMGLPVPQRLTVSLQKSAVETALPGLLTTETLEATLVTMMAGRAAEIEVLGTCSVGAGLGPGSDLAQATRLAFEAQAAFHLSDHSDLVWRSSSDVSGQLSADPALAAHISRRLKSAHQKAAAVLRDERPRLQRVARAALHHRELDHDMLKALLADPPATSAPTEPTNLILEQDPS